MDEGKPKWHAEEFLYTSVIGDEKLPIHDHTSPHNNFYTGTGFVLRRTQIVEDACNSKPSAAADIEKLSVESFMQSALGSPERETPTRQVPIAELLIKNYKPEPRLDLPIIEKIIPEFLINVFKRVTHKDGYYDFFPSVDDPGIFFRWVPMNCGEEIGISSRIGPLFRPLSGGPVTKVIFDP